MSFDQTNYSVSTSQGNISVWDSQGAGLPVVFLHGNSACKESFQKQFNSVLASQYRFIAIDLPGHGRSDKAADPENTYSVEGYAKVASEVIEKLNLGVKPAMVGWSLGGHIALEVSKKCHNLAGVLITGTPPINISQEGFAQGFHPLPLFQTLFTKVKFTEEEADQFMSGGGFDTSEAPFIVRAALETDGYARLNLAMSMMNGVGGNQREFVEQDNTPLCIVQGKEDAGVNNEYIQGIEYKNLFSGRAHIIEGSGHAVFWKKPEEFNEVLSLFLSSLSGSAGI